MLLTREQLAIYRDEIEGLYIKYIPDVPNNRSVIHFGIIENSELLAAATLKCYVGHWHMRTCVVKPEYRGRGLQRKLIRERVKYLDGKTDIVRVSALPENKNSIRNIEAEGFVFEKTKRTKYGVLLNVYKKSLD